MLFNSFEFLIFLPLVFGAYWFLVNKNLRLQNLFVAVASYIFYGAWDWKFLLLILASTVVDFWSGQAIRSSEEAGKKKLFLVISMVFNLGVLGIFKYFNFFIDNAQALLEAFGVSPNVPTLQVILPVGISFYTFQTMSYTIDVYRGKIEPTRDFIAFAAFVSFFPQLVAGPIERASNLLPQFYAKRNFDYAQAVDGCKQILWGFFKKLVIADNCAEIANLIFNNHENYRGITLFIGAVFFAFQIYGDFSGYSDIAIGVAKLFGFTLMTNFFYPYFSRNIGEFWRRWHISLSTWFRDYLYIPLGGSRGGTWMSIRNILAIFLVSGFWHGANWTFIFWGLLNALYFLPSFMRKSNRRFLDADIPLKDLPFVLITFIQVVFAWILFRAENIADALSIYKSIFTGLGEKSNWAKSFNLFFLQENYIILLIILFLAVEWVGRFNSYPVKAMFVNKFRVVRWGFYCSLIVLIGIYTPTEESPFIYFQF